MIAQIAAVIRRSQPYLLADFAGVALLAGVTGLLLNLPAFV